MRLRSVRRSWLGMTASRPTAAAATSSVSRAAAATARRLTHAPPSASFARRRVVGPSTSSLSRPQPSSSVSARLLAANLATLAAAATATRASCTHQPTHSHSHSHYSPYQHPYRHLPASSSTRSASVGSSNDTDTDDDILAVASHLQLPQPQPSSQFHPQHHHRLITARTAPSSSHRHHNSKMPRRKETKKIFIDIPSSEASRGIAGDPHQVFKCNGSPIISPRSIRNSLAETDFDVDGNPRPQKIANNAELALGTTVGSHNHQGVVALGPDRPPSTDKSDNKKKQRQRRRVDDSSAPTSRPGTPGTPGTPSSNSNGRTLTRSDMDLLALKVAEQSLAGMSGVQLWVHRLLYTHHQTLHVLGLERGAFPNTRLSLKQLETMLSPVVTLANLMTPEHFGIHVPTPQIAQTMNDVHYWKLWESDTIDIGIFFMPPNSHIPLHNHPGMSVVTRVLYGSVNIRSYDLMSEDEYHGTTAPLANNQLVSADSYLANGGANDDANKQSKKNDKQNDAIEASPDDAMTTTANGVNDAAKNGDTSSTTTTTTPSVSSAVVGHDPKVLYARVSREGPYEAETTMWLDPRRFNLHQIHAASENGCAMLDIMIPPYNNADRDCHHFQILEEQYLKDKNERIVKMIASILKGNHNEPTASSRDAPKATEKANETETEKETARVTEMETDKPETAVATATPAEPLDAASC